MKPWQGNALMLLGFAVLEGLLMYSCVGPF